MTHSNPILDKIFRLSENKHSGTLSLVCDKNSIQLHFKDGEISAAASNLPDYKIGRFLSRKGFIQESGITDLLKESRKKKLLLGETAVRRRLLDDSALSSLIHDQIVQLIMHALTSDFEIQDFKDSIKPFYLPARFSSQQLMLEMARRNIHPFAPDPRQRIVLSNGDGPTNVSWYPQELSVISGLKNPRTIQELAIFSGLEYARLCKILSVLDQLHMITTTEDSAKDTPAVLPLEDPSSQFIVPEIKETALSDKLDVCHNPSSFISEQFKSLKVRLHELHTNHQVKVITVSSPYRDEGKSLVCTNLGLCFAKDPNRRVILIDCDLRNPTVHKYLGTSISPGLHGYLVEEDSLQPHHYMRRLDRLFIMTAGEFSSDPIELLSQDKMRQLIEYLRRDFDTVIIDTPPMGLVSDANIMTNLSDGLIMVVRSNQTTYTNLERSFKSLDRKKLLGVVLNDVQAHMFNTQYDYRYYHYNNRNVYPYGPKKNGSSRRTSFK